MVFVAIFAYTFPFMDIFKRKKYALMDKYTQLWNTLQVIILIHLQKGVIMDGQRLKELRVKQGHTQESLAELIGADNRQVWRWESGKYAPSADMLINLAQALNTTADYLLGLTDDPSPIRGDGLKASEQRVLSAMRRGDIRAAILAILTSEDDLAKT